MLDNLQEMLVLIFTHNYDWKGENHESLKIETVFATRGGTLNGG